MNLDGTKMVSFRLNKLPQIRLVSSGTFSLQQATFLPTNWLRRALTKRRLYAMRESALPQNSGTPNKCERNSQKTVTANCGKAQKCHRIWVLDFPFFFLAWNVHMGDGYQLATIDLPCTCFMTLSEVERAKHDDQHWWWPWYRLLWVGRNHHC